MVSYRAAVIFPAFNEAKRLRIESFREFARQHLELLLVFVNDGSTDETGKRLNELSAEENISIIELGANQGKAEAIRQGILSLEKMEIEILGFADSDLATPLVEIARVLSLCPQHRSFFTIGSRKKLKDNKIERRKIRLYASFIFKQIVALSTRVRVEDSQCGLKFFSRDLAFELFRRPFVSRWLFDVELLFRFNQLQLHQPPIKLESISLQKWTDISGGSLGVKDFLLSPFVLAYIIWSYSGKRGDK